MSEANRPAGPAGGERSDDGPSRSVGSNIAALMASQSITWILATLTIWVVPRYLGPVDLGRIAVGGSIWGIASVFAFGTRTWLTVEVARRRSTVTDALSQVLRLRIILFIAILPLVGLAMWVGDYDTTTIQVVALLGVAGFFGLVSDSTISALSGLQEMSATARVSATTKFVKTAGTIGVLLAGGRLFGVVSVEILAAVVAAALLLRELKRRRPAHMDPTNFVGRHLMAASAPFLLAGAARVVYQQIDTVVMSLLIGEEPVGWYAAADMLWGSLMFVPVIIMTALLPAIADVHERAPSEVPALMQRTFSALWLVAVPIGVGTIVVGPSFVELLMGSAFIPTGHVLQIFGVVLIFTGQNILLGQFAMATGRVKTWTVIMVGAVVVSVALDIILVPWADDRYGNAALGGPMAYVITELLILVAGVAILAPHLVNRASLARIARCLVGGAVMAGVSWPLRDQLFLLPGFVGVVAFAATVLALRTLSEDEWGHVARLRRTVGQVGKNLRGTRR